jgi:hypothetical protein
MMIPRVANPGKESYRTDPRSEVMSLDQLTERYQGRKHRHMGLATRYPQLGGRTSREEVNRALNKNLDKCAYYAAFWRTRNSVLVAAKRCAFRSR